jgi:glycosyltransferase involved in cell wall biosynthesis
MLPSLSVVVCTHDPRLDFLERTLDSLRALTLDVATWELLIVDNASAQAVGEHLDLSWHPRARCVIEPRVGLTQARIRAIAETSAELILFIDDDNLVAADYAELLLGLAAQYPQLGCFGAGRILPEYETEPAPELRPYLPMLALREVEKPCWSNLPDDGFTPWGAGLAVRREVAKSFAQRVEQDDLRRHLGRQGTTLNSGEDDEFSWIACEMGMGKGLFPALEVTHLIDRKRLARDYLLGIAEGHAFSRAILEFLHRGELPPDSAASVGATAGHLLAGRASEFWAGSRRIRARMRMSALEKAFADARRLGSERARAACEGSAPAHGL